MFKFYKEIIKVFAKENITYAFLKTEEMLVHFLDNLLEKCTIVVKQLKALDNFIVHSIIRININL